MDGWIVGRWELDGYMDGERGRRVDDIYPDAASGLNRKLLCSLDGGGILGEPGPVGKAMCALSCEPTELCSSPEARIPSVASHKG